MSWAQMSQVKSYEVSGNGKGEKANQVWASPLQLFANASLVGCSYHFLREMSQKAQIPQVTPFRGVFSIAPETR
jgi:hypothetical protein